LELERGEIYKFQLINISKYPPCGFYKTTNNIIKRVFNTFSEIEMSTVSCLIMCTNITMDGTNVDELIKIDNWNDDDIGRIRLNDNPGIFIDPLGYVLMCSDDDCF
jgi:hypothetical protein